MKHINLSLLIGKMLIVSLFFLTTFSSLFASSESEVITTIILIDRQAELVDVDQFGEVLRRHVAVPDYFSSGRSHTSSLRRSLQKVKDYGLIQTDFSIPGSSDLPGEALQSFLVQSSEVSKKAEYCTMSTNDILSEPLLIATSPNQGFRSFFGDASLKEEDVKEDNTKRKSGETPFSHYRISLANYSKQRIRGQMRYYNGRLNTT